MNSQADIFKREARKFLKKRLAIDGLAIYVAFDDYAVYTEIRKKTIFGGWLSSTIARYHDLRNGTRIVYVFKQEWYSKIQLVYSELMSFYPSEHYKVRV